MEFNVNLETNQNVPDIKDVFYQQLQDTKKILRGLYHFEKKGNVQIVKIPADGYRAHIHLQIPHHRIHVYGEGHYPIQALKDGLVQAQKRVFEIDAKDHGPTVIWERCLQEVI